ncbi:uncharacterized protein LOC112467887 [Temnothorax curvispinosus]|nr:uncharacterized protein LOC112467887 [Temnothorax curvispinosus]
MPVNCFDKGSLNEQICSHKLNNSSVSNDSNSKKRKNVFTQNKAVKRVRFMNGFKTEYIFREDFVSDEAWNRFLRFTTYKKSKMAAAHNKNSRKGKKIKNLKVLIKEKKKEKKHSL